MHLFSSHLIKDDIIKELKRLRAQISQSLVQLIDVPTRYTAPKSREIRIVSHGLEFRIITLPHLYLFDTLTRERRKALLLGFVSFACVSEEEYTCNSPSQHAVATPLPFHPMHVHQREGLHESGIELHVNQISSGKSFQGTQLQRQDAVRYDIV